ncbi:hypothetical protein [Myroides odoratimimus]|uniref:hypothetical protein n=1 Tax=Myroides odoratimimus TaxID=76832 RepID=UPI0025766863|nr:hypothetical protein [Myroides odoratimimus]MDM1465164.1 hypothetical protein [Myroides odoratimimus]MDM1475151.1 hypothetical protein [Myroides odoratimimus]
MTNYDFFRTKHYSLFQVESKRSIYSDELLVLIKDEQLREAIINKYDLTNSILIDIDKVDIIYDEVKRHKDRFDLIRLNVPENKVTTYLATNPETTLVDYYFNIIECSDNDGVIYNDLNAVAINDSINLFYKDRSLSQYVKYLKSNNKVNKDQLLLDLNDSWLRHFDRNPNDIKDRVFRILRHNGLNYVKSINTEKYQEYGISESFVLSMLEFNKIQVENKGIKFKISSIYLSESKIDMIVTLDKKDVVKDVGVFRPSISIRNEDQGNTSLGVYNSIEFYPENAQEQRIYLFPKKDNTIEEKTASSHTITKENLIKLFGSISNLFVQLEQFKSDFKFYQGTKSADELRQKIQERVCSPNGVFKGITELHELFNNKNNQKIENLESLLIVCGQAEMLDMDYDLKFKLRYIISNVLLYGHNQI